MDSPYSVRFGYMSRNEWVEFQDLDSYFCLSVSLNAKKKEWTIYVPGNGFADKSSPNRVRVMTAKELEYVLPKVTKFLSRIWWFWIFPVSYSIKIKKPR
jgi:hypothetical protein